MHMSFVTARMESQFSRGSPLVPSFSFLVKQARKYVLTNPARSLSLISHFIRKANCSRLARAMDRSAFGTLKLRNPQASRSIYLIPADLLGNRVPILSLSVASMVRSRSLNSLMGNSNSSAHKATTPYRSSPILPMDSTWRLPFSAGRR